MTKPRTPRSVEGATRLLERFAELDGQIATIEIERTEAIAAINARADTAANDLIGQRAAVQAALSPWWAEHGSVLTEGKRKSIELGGCVVGSRRGKDALGLAGEEKTIVAALSPRLWAKKLLRVKLSVDRTAVLAALDGAHGAALAELGLTRQEGSETFFIERTRQTGTLAVGR